MAYILTYLYTRINAVFEEHKDERIERYPLMGSMLPMFSILAIYLTFVLHYGPKWMEHRKPYSLKLLIQFYNAIQVLSNIVLLYHGVGSFLGNDFSFRCQPIDPHNREPWMLRLLDVTYGYYLTKYLDLLDTVFFILRKKNKQITFLHVYHHSGMIFAVHVHLKFLAGSHSTVIGLINLFIHTVMYSYYFMSSLNAVKETLWWKRHITQLQLLQFGYLIVHFLQVIFRNECHYPTIVIFVGLIQNLFMFAMFSDFYIKTYIRKPKSQPQQSHLTNSVDDNTEVQKTTAVPTANNAKVSPASTFQQCYQKMNGTRTKKDQ